MKSRIFRRASWVVAGCWIELAAPAAQACQCGRIPTVEEAMTTADEAFVGTVVEVWPVRLGGERTGDDSVGQRSTLRVDRRFRGEPRATEQFVDSGGNCSFRFARGETYLVFGCRYGRAQHLAASICSPTEGVSRLEGAARASLDLPPVAAVPPESLIHLAARRLELGRLVAAGTLRRIWRTLADSTGGLLLRLALPSLLAGAAAVLVLQLRRRRFLLAALWFVGVPAMLAASLIAWGYWLAFDNPWFASLAQ